MSEQVVTSLIGQVKVSADTKPLVDFEKRMDSVAAKMRTLTGMSGNRVSVLFSVDKAQVDTTIAGLRSKKIILNNLGLDPSALNSLVTKIASKSFKISNITLASGAINSIITGIKNALISTPIKFTPILDISSLTSNIKARKKTIESSLRFRATLHLNRAATLRNIRSGLASIERRIGGISIAAKILKLGVDKPYLIASIQAALHNHIFTIRVGGGIPPGFGGGGAGALAAGAAMGYAGKLGRGFLPGLGVAYSISQLNRMNQQLQANALAMQAVSGNGERFDPQQQIDWFKKMSFNLGIDYRESMGEYTKMLATGTTSGYTVGETQNIYAGISSYGRVLGLDDERMKRVMKAVEQMMAKGQVMS
jgi:hypothetical protein